VTAERQTNAFTDFLQSSFGKNLALGAGIALVMSIMGAVWMWGQKPDYRVLLSNYSDRDGGAIIDALQKMNIPYQYAEGGGAILVPAERVHDARLKLATQGLPKGGTVGFELMENQKLGVSQFLEQINFQRALEGELSRSINSIASIQTSRVLLAIPKPTVFVREKQLPTASVLLNLYQGRTLDKQQVNAIMHLVSSSVPELTTQNVTIVDQNGALLSSIDNQADNNQLDPNQLKYIKELQDGIVRRIESILTPMVGAGNIRAEASADVDFSRSEQAAETYKPNGTAENASKRSEQSNESSNSDSDKAGGVPGANSNQPGQAVPSPAPAPTKAATAPVNTQKESTINYEVDKTIRYDQHPMGNIKRLSVAVLVNNKTEIDEKGKSVVKPLTDAEKEQITGLVREAMGFSKDRGDSLNVVNTAFTLTPEEILPEQPFWKQFANLDMAKTASQYLISGLVILYLFFAVLRPMIRRIAAPVVAPEASAETVDTDSIISEEPSIPPPANQENHLQAAKKMATEDPQMVANIVKNWIRDNE
jgi:flagellar M-ring protein FliF